MGRASSWVANGRRVSRSHSDAVVDEVAEAAGKASGLSMTPLVATVPPLETRPVSEVGQDLGACMPETCSCDRSLMTISIVYPQGVGPGVARAIGTGRSPPRRRAKGSGAFTPLAPHHPTPPASTCSREWDCPSTSCKRQATKHVRSEWLRWSILRKVIDAIGTRRDLVIVGHSLGSLVAIDLTLAPTSRHSRAWARPTSNRRIGGITDPARTRCELPIINRNKAYAVPR